MQKDSLFSRINLPVLLILPVFIGVFYQAKENPAASTRPPARRIVSLSPSITRELADLGCADLVAGVTSYDDAPRAGWKIVGSMIQPDIEAIASIRPDLVLFSMEDNPTQHTERLAVTGIASYVFPRNPDFTAISENYLELARVLNREKLASEKIKRYSLELALHQAKRSDPPRVAFFVSHRPLIAASGASFLGKIIADAGAVNILGEGTAPYPLPSLEFLVLRNPQFIVSIMPDAGRFFTELLKDFPELEAVKHSRIYYIKPDHWGYYTPADYVAAVRQLASIIDSGRKGR